MRKLILLLALLLIPIFPIFAVEAIDALDNITENNSGVVDTKSVDARAWFLEGNALYDQRKYEESLDAYNKAIQLEPGNGSIWSNKGCVLYDLERYRDSVDACDEAIRLDPTDAIAWINKGDSLKKLENFLEALDCYDEAIKLDPTDESASNSKGFLLAFHGTDVAIAQNTRGAAERKAVANQTNDDAVRNVIVYPATMYPPINDTTPGFSAVPGEYDATQVSIPLGPYRISFLTRLENVTVEGKYELLGHNETAGSGKDYHICTYDVGELRILRNSTAAQRMSESWTGGGYPIAEFDFTIYRYAGPSTYPPVDPDPSGFSRISSFRDTATLSQDYTTDSITIDGKQGTLLTRWATYHNENYYGESHDVVGNSCYIATYQPNDKTFVVLKADSSLDYDKDVALVLQTLHITEV
jgi:tetratricopeptide (TPR) repeat protein